MKNSHTFFSSPVKNGTSATIWLFFKGANVGGHSDLIYGSIDGKFCFYQILIVLYDPVKNFHVLIKIYCKNIENIFPGNSCHRPLLERKVAVAGVPLQWKWQVWSRVVACKLYGWFAFLSVKNMKLSLKKLNFIKNMLKSWKNIEKWLIIYV